MPSCIRSGAKPCYRSDYRSTPAAGDLVTQRRVPAAQRRHARPADISGRFIEYAGKRVIQGVVRDISERKATEAALQLYRQNLEDLVTMRTADLSALNLQLQHEIEERLKIEASLRRSTEQFRSVVETCSDAIVTADSSGNIALWNKGAENLFGYQAQEILGKPFLRLIAGDMQESHRHYLRSPSLNGSLGS